MASTSSKSTVVGLDIGQAEVKAVALAVRGKQVQLLKSQVLDIREEGFLDEAELRSSVAEWLDENGWSGAELSLGLPQYLTTTQISDFPAGVNKGLDEMVAYETRQLAGLSDENFLHDYHVMAPAYGRKNPVLIGICRESVIRETARSLKTAGIELAELSMNGLAVANTFFHVQPEALDVDEPQMLVDIGAQSSTMVVVAGGEVLFIGSLLFGGEKVTEALAKHLGTSDEDAERAKLTSRLNPNDTRSPLFRTTQQLENELRTSVEHWRAQERAEIGGKMFSKVWLCGGGARLNGLADYFARTYGCEAAVFGPAARKGGGEKNPALTTAFGLALQGCGASRVAISLCPPETRWQRVRKHRFGYLVATFLLMTAFLALFLTHVYRRLTEAEKDTSLQMAELARCDGLIPKLQDTLRAIEHHERMVIPFAEKGNRARRFVQTIVELRHARAPDDWVVYVADEVSYARGKRKLGPGGKPLPGTDDGNAGPLGIEATDTDELGRTLTKMHPVEDIRRLTSMVVGVYTPYERGNRYGPVREIVRKLNRENPDGEKQADQRGLFAKVDLLSEDECKGREDIFKPWTEQFKKAPSMRYMDFTLRLPFEYLDVTMPPATAPKKP